MPGGGKKSKRDGERKKDKKRGRDARDEQYELDEYDDEEEILSNLDEKGVSSEWSVPTAAAVDVEAKVIIWRDFCMLEDNIPKYNPILIVDKLSDPTCNRINWNLNYYHFRKKQRPKKTCMALKIFVVRWNSDLIMNLGHCGLPQTDTSSLKHFLLYINMRTIS